MRRIFPFFALFLLFVLTGCPEADYYNYQAVPSINDDTQEGDVGFIFFGDWGTGTGEQTLVANSMIHYCKTHQCQFVVGLGDNFYPAGVQSVDDSKWKTHFMDRYGKLGLTFYSALGNHDHGGDVDAQIAYTDKNPLWYMPSAYYKFTKGNIDFFALDTDPPSYKKAQIDWIKRELARETEHWRIVFGHHPVYSYGMHGNSPGLVETLDPSLQKYANFYLAGHEHDRQVLKKNEIYYLISGAAGQTRKEASGPLSLFASGRLGFMHMKVRGKKAHVTVLDRKGRPEWEVDVDKKDREPSSRPKKH